MKETLISIIFNKREGEESYRNTGTTTRNIGEGGRGPKLFLYLHKEREKGLGAEDGRRGVP